MAYMNENKCILKNINKTLLILLVILLATCIRLYPIYQYSQEPTSYQGSDVLRSNYLLENGHALPSYRGEMILDKLEAIKSIIVQLTPTQNLLLTSTYQSFIFCLIILLFTKGTSNNNLILTTLVIAFSISATPDIIFRLSGWNGPYAWMFFFMSLYLILFKSKNVATVFLSLLLLLIIPATYFTESLFVAVILSTAFIFHIFLNKGVFSNNIIILYISFFIAWLMYMSISGFSTIFNILSMVQSFVQQDSRIITLNYLAGGTKISMIKNAISNILASLPLFYLILKGNKLLDGKIYNLFLVAFTSICFLSVVFFLWMGVTGVFQRIPLYVILFSIISFSLLSGLMTKKKHLNVLIIIGVITIIFSNFVYVTSDYNDKLTFDEAAGTHWLMHHTSKEEVIFTDLRLSAPFIANGYSTIGINDVSLPPNKVDKMLESIFYEVDSPIEAFKQLKMNQKNIKYLYFSNRYTERFPGIKGRDYNFLPANIDFIEMYAGLNEYNIIYRNEDTIILLIKST